MPTHGSLSKAGKVRSQTPKIASRGKSNPIPRVSKRRAYENRVILRRNIGQFRPEGRNRRR